MLTDERASKSDVVKTERFFYKDGIEEFVKQLGKNKQVIHPKPIVLARQKDEVFVDCVMQYNDSNNEDFVLLTGQRSEEHTSELQSHSDLVCRLLLEQKNNTA